MTSDDTLLDESDFERTVIGQNANSLLENVYGLRLKSPVAELPLQLNPILIGRDATCTLQLPSRMVSRHHAVIYKAGKHHIVRDLHSTNGVVHNGVRTTRAVIRAGDTLQLGDQKLYLVQGQPIHQSYAEKCVVVFIDLENSTAYSEQYGEKFSQDMEAQMQLLEDKILIQLGSPVKMLGDGLMCAFGLWPVEKEGYQAVDQAVRFAWQAVQAFRKVPGYSPLRLRVGMHWGPVMVADRNQMDLFGDTVNTAARLEDSNKHYGTQIMVTSEIRNRTRLSSCFREVDTVRVQGKDEPVTLFAWDETYVETRATAHRQPYEQALALYRQGQLPEALTLLQQGAEMGDALCDCLAERIVQITHLPANWDGIWSISKTH